MNIKNLKYWHGISVFSLIGLILLIIIWNGWLAKVQLSPKSFEIGLLILPLLFFIRGILNGKYQTHVYIMFIALIYLLLGTWYAFTPTEGIYGILMILLSISLYVSAYLYTRTIMIRDKNLENHQ